VRVQDIATVPRRLLKKPVANLSPQRDEILAALDFYSPVSDPLHSESPWPNT
jgi:hypothetical protein